MSLFTTLHRNTKPITAAFIVMLIGFTLFFSINVGAQSRVLGKDTLSAVLLGIEAGVHVPAVDLAKRYGLITSVGGSFTYKTKKNWLMGISGQHLYTNRLAEANLISNLSTSDGLLIGTSGLPADVFFSLAGWQATANIGKLIPLHQKRPNSGLLITLGGGYFQHKINIADRGQSVPQLTGDYAQGYDRLTRGGAISQFIGYLHLGKRKRINYYVGASFTQGFTKGIRSLHFDTLVNDSDYLRKDLMFGLRFGWVLPLYTASSGAYYIN